MKERAGTSASVLADILGACEELRWMEPHTSSPSPCLIGVVEGNPLSRGGHTQVAGFGAFSRHPLPLNQWTKTFSQGWTHTHRAVFGAVKVVVRPGASSSVLTPRGTFVQKAPNCWRNEELVDT